MNRNKNREIHCSKGSDPFEERGTEAEASKLDGMVSKLFESIGEIFDIVAYQIGGV